MSPLPEVKCDDPLRSNVSATGRRVWIDPRGDGASGGSGLQRVRHARQANTAAAGFHFHRAGNRDNANAAAAGLRVDRAAHFAEIDLAAASVHVHKISGMRDGDIATDCFEVRAAADSHGADVAAAGAQRSISRDAPYADVAAPGKRREVCWTANSLNMAALRFELRERPDEALRSPAPPSRPVRMFPPCVRRIAVPPMLLCFDVADFRVYVNAVAAWNCYFKLDPELRVAGVGRLRWERAASSTPKFVGLALSTNFPSCWAAGP